MKKIFLMITIITMTLVLTACGTKKEKYKGLWNYTQSGLEYSVELLDDNKWVMKQGEATREGTYEVEQKDGCIVIKLEYNKTYGYMKYQDDKMCAITESSSDCDFYFQRAEGELLSNF